MTTTAGTKAEATLGGKQVILRQPASWRLTEGVSPSIGTFEMAPDDALDLASKSEPISLVMTPLEGNPVRIQNLYVINILPGPNPWISEIQVADRRVWWPYGHVLLRMNMRRAVGTKRLVANDQQLVLNPTASSFKFWKWSLENGNRRFVALNMLKKVFEQVGKPEKDRFDQNLPWKVDDRIGSKLRNLPIEELQIDDPGDLAMKRAVAVLPEAGVTIDYDGTAIIFSRAAGDESEIVKALMPEIRDQGHTDLVKNANLRPKKINVYFTREVEVRFDFIESAAAQGSTITAGGFPLADRREMENVVPVTDYQLQVTEVDAQPLCQGTWITVDQAFRAWGNMPTLGDKTFKIDHKFIQRAFIPHMDLWAAFQLAGDRPDDKGNLANWTGRISALQNHYRQTFRLNSRWMDRFLSVRAYRIGTIDPQSGQRGPSMAYGDYEILYTQRSIWRNRAQAKKLEYSFGRSAFPDGGNLDDSAEPSPAVVQLLDHDQGIVHLDYRGTDPLSGDTRMILPSRIVEGSRPTLDVRSKTQSISFDSVIEGQEPPRLSPSFRVAIVLTAVPASPNSKQQLHKIEVKPEDISDLLPASQRTGLSECNGPEMDIRIGPNVEVARIRWDDTKSKEIEKIFGLTDGEPNLEGLILNDGDKTDIEKGASIQLIARAAAARLYASLVDRYEGEMTAHMNGGVHLAGHIGEIVHELGSEGETLTRVNFPPQIPQMSLLSFLDSSTRAAILHLTQPEA